VTEVKKALRLLCTIIDSLIAQHEIDPESGFVV
jgi:hypothetical protein